MSQQFFEAIRAGDRGKVERCWMPNAGLLGAKDEKGLGAYTAAKYSGRNEIAALLLERGVELDVFAACMAGARERVVELIGREPGAGQSVQPRRMDAAAPGMLFWPASRWWKL